MLIPMRLPVSGLSDIKQSRNARSAIFTLLSHLFDKGEECNKSSQDFDNVPARIKLSLTVTEFN